VDFHILSVVAIKSTVHTECVAQFDTDSGPVGIDNRCSACISHKRADFIGELFPRTQTIKGFEGTRVSSIHMGTLQWHWDDDQGVTHSFLIPNSYYLPERKVRLLSPQHWAQSISSKDEMCGEIITAKECTLYWNQGHSALHIPYGKKDNNAKMYLSPGFHNFAVFCAEAELFDSDSDPVAHPTEVMSNTESE
jgi:hypothetical protein